MRAWKFLADGAVGPFTGFRWPVPNREPGPWVSAPAGAAEDRWVHACRLRDLPCWFGPELWEVELAEPVAPRRYQVASPRARLLRRVTGWDRGAAAEFARACAERARELAARAAPGSHASTEAYLETVLRYPERPAVVAFVNSLLAELVGGSGAREAERSWQASWLAERLALAG